MEIPAEQTEQSAFAFRADLRAGLEREALRLGFSRLGVASPDAARRDPRLHAHFRRWLDDGHAGAMEGWLREHEPLRRDPQTMLEGVRSVIMLATDHAVQPPEPIVSGTERSGQGRVARYAWGRDYHDLFRQRVNALAVWLEQAQPGCRTRGFVDSAPFPEREFAWLAGLGWFGKNTMLIDPTAGSYFLLTVLLTDVELPAAVPIAMDHCGTCTACLDACPTDAFVEPRVLDANRCLSAITIEDRGPVAHDLRAALGDWIFGCDVCQEVCPWNRHAPGSAEPWFQPRDGEATLPLAELLALDDAAFRRRFKGTPLVRAKRSGLLRSAAIALGNRPDAASADALVAALADHDEIVRAAAAWALGRWRHAEPVLAAIAHEALSARLPLETSNAVCAEIEAALP
jgi:epoxyqueuosine reductase